MDPQQQQLAQIEGMAEKMYNSPDPAERARAEASLKISSPSAEALSQCHFILDNSNSVYAQYLATSSLTKLFTENWIAFTPQQRLESKTCAMRFLANKGRSLQQFVMLSAMQLIARITKLGWLQDEAQQAICSDIRELLETSPPHAVICLSLYTAIVQEMSVVQTGVRISMAQHNRTAGKFRDSSLLGIFSVALSALRDCLAQTNSPVELREAAMKLALQCLSFNFIGALADDSADDVGTIQVPAQWRSHFEDEAFLNLFFQLYATSPPSVASLALECVVQIAAVRRSLFSSEAERVKFLSNMMAGVKTIMDGRIGLADQSNHHVLCRLLSRIKANYQLQQFTATEGWQAWISSVFQFTVASMDAWRWSPTSIHYLMSFWSRMVTSMMYITSGQAPTCIVKFAPKIMEAFVKTRLDSVQLALQVPDEDPLGSEDLITEQLEYVPSMGKCDYQETSAFLLTLIDSMTTALSQQQMPAGDQRAALVLGQFAWMVYIIGSIIGGRLLASSNEDSDAIDGALACRVFHLMRFTDARVPGLSQEQRAAGESPEAKLELAYLAFMQHFRRMYIGDSALSTSKAFSKMGELLGLGTHEAVLNVVVTKITSNLKWWKGNGTVVDRTLGLFFDLGSGYSSGKLVAKLDIIAQILDHHTDDAFSFPANKSGGKQRALFYNVLGRLLFTEDHRERFDAFMKPFEVTLDFLMSQPSAEALLQAQCRELVLHVCQKLTGLFASVINVTSFLTLFEWIHPRYLQLFPRIVEVYHADREVARCVLGLVSEISHNKANRIRFDVQSPNGLLLFKECCGPTVTLYGTRLLVLPVLPQQDVYKERYKQIISCLEIMTHSMGGEYVPFGVFGLYNDTCFSDSLSATFRLALAVPVQEVMAYAKFSKALLTFLDVLCGSQPMLVASVDAAATVRIFQLIEEGINSTDSQVTTLCCTMLDSLLSWYVAARRKAPGSAAAEQAMNLERGLNAQPTLLPNIFGSMFRVILTTDCQFLYTIARPIHVLMIVAPQHYESIKTNIVASQAIPAQEKLLASFAKLSSEIVPKLDTKSREKFIQSLVVFAHESRSFINPSV